MKTEDDYPRVAGSADGDGYHRSKCDNPACGCNLLDVALGNHIPLSEAAREGAEAVLGAFSAKMTEMVTGSYWGLPATAGGSGAAEDVVKYVLSALRAEGAAAERARIRQMVLDEATLQERVAKQLAPRGVERTGHEFHAQALRDFAALLEKP